jgi:two-component system response regulator AtoC
MNISATENKCFLVSTDSKFYQPLTSLIPSRFELIVFENFDLLFKEDLNRPCAIFIDLEDKTEDVNPFLEKILGYYKNVSIILISKKDNITDFNVSLKPNIYNYYSKEELTRKRLYFLLKNISQNNNLQNRLEKLDTKMHHVIVEKMVYSCSIMQRVAILVNKASSSDIPCYISGKKGTGKGTAAYLIHHLSNKRSFPYFKLNFGNIKYEELEKEVFGYENYKNQIFQAGKLELASGGSIYLEEVHLMPLKFQAKVLDAIKSGYFQRIGGSDDIELNIRFITSTSKDLFSELDTGNFLESLYYRLMGLTINIPPLKDRGNDIILLATKIMNDFFERNNFNKKVLSKKAKQKLLSYSFPGNIKELKSIIERAIVLADESIISEEDIEFGNSSTQISFLEQTLTFEEYKSKIIHHFLEKYDNDIQVVSSKLDIGKSTIYRMLKSEKEKNANKMTWFDLI